MTTLTDFQLLVLEKETIHCEDVSELLGDYVEGDLTPTLHDRITDHVSSCSECKELEGDYREVIQLASELKPEPMPLEVQNRLRSALNERLGIELPMADA